MSTLMGQAGATAPYGHTHEGWSERHPAAAVVMIVVGVVICCLMLGLLVIAFAQGPATIAVHHGGGAHARAATLLRVHHTLSANHARVATLSSNHARAATLAANQGAAATQDVPVTQSDSMAVKRVRTQQSLVHSGGAVGRGHVGTNRS